MKLIKLLLFSFDLCYYGLFFSINVASIYMFLHIYSEFLLDNIQLSCGFWSTVTILVFNLCTIPLAFKMIIDEVRHIITIFITVFYLFLLFFVPIFVFHSFSVVRILNRIFYMIPFSLLSILIMLFTSFFQWKMFALYI